MHKFTLTHETAEGGTQAEFTLPDMATIEDVTEGFEQFLTAVFGYPIVLAGVVIAEPVEIIEEAVLPLAA